MNQYHSLQSLSNLQKYRIHIFALCYLISTISYSSVTTMMFSLYSQKGIANIALVNGIFAFIGFGISNMIVLHILRKFNLKYGLVIGFSGLLLCQINVMFTVFIADKNIAILSSIPFLYIINIVTTLLTGISNSINWTILPTYIQAHCDDIQKITNNINNNNNISVDEQQNKNSMTTNMGLFWSIYMWSVIIGGLLNVFVLGFSGNFIYAILIISLAILSIILVILFVWPFQVKKLNINNNNDNINDNNNDNNSIRQLSTKQSIKQQILNLIRIVKSEENPQNRLPNILVYNFFAGLILNFFTIFMNKVIKKSLPLDIQQQQYNKLTAIVFIFQGIGSMLTGLFQNKFYALLSKNKQKSLIWGICLSQSSMFLTMFIYNSLQNSGNAYWTCILLIVCWACTQTHIKTNTQAYIRQYNGGKIQLYSLSILFYSLGSIINYIILMIDNQNWQMLAMIYICGIITIIWLARQPNIQLIYAKVGNSQIELRFISKQQNINQQKIKY